MAETKYVSYCRVSTDRQRTSLETQNRTIDNYLTSLGCNAVCCFSEIASGKKNQPELENAIEYCTRNNCTLVAVRPDRLTRRSSYGMSICNNIKVLFVDMPGITSDELKVYFDYAELEGKFISKRTKSAFETLKQSGRKLGSPNNLLNNLNKAITNSIRTNKEKAKNNINNIKAVSKLEELVRKTSNYSEMARILNRDGYVTSKGGLFTAKQVQLLIRRYDIKDDSHYTLF